MDVPDSSICIIDNASNFGLSQLHQIRGRIGRGEKPPLETLEECFCVLLYDDRPDSDENRDDDIDMIGDKNDNIVISRFTSLHPQHPPGIACTFFFVKLG